MPYRHNTGLVPVGTQNLGGSQPVLVGCDGDLHKEMGGHVFTDNHPAEQELGVQDIIFIKDLKTDVGTPRLARIIDVDTDSTGVERYYTWQYIQRNIATFKKVSRPAQSLCLLLTANEINSKEDVTRDSLEFPAKIPHKVSRKSRRVKVTVPAPSSEIKDI